MQHAASLASRRPFTAKGRHEKADTQMTFEPCRKTSFFVLSSCFRLFSAAVAVMNFDDGCYCSFSVTINRSETHSFM